MCGRVVEFDQIHVDADESKFIFRRSMSIVMIVGVCLDILSGVQTEKLSEGMGEQEVVDAFSMLSL